MMWIRCCVMLLLLGLWPWVAQADIVCDGVDDDADTGVAFSTFASATTATLVVSFTPAGTAQTGGDNCYYGEATLGIYQNGAFSGDIGIFRNGSYFGNDRLCGFNYDGTEDVIPSAYAAGVRQHVALVHAGGNLTLYLNGAQVGSPIASGNTGNTAATMRICLGASRLDNPSYQVLNGRIHEAKVYPVALTAGQIAAEALSGVHNVITTTPSGLWLFNTCPIGTNGNAVSFRDTSGNTRPMVGDDGANNTGLTCQGSNLSYQWGVW